MFTLVRDRRTENSILGRLFIGGTCICYTLENASKAIPAGWYTVENSKSPKFKRELPLLYSLNVLASRGVRIHSGNTWKDSSACVLVGMKRDDAKERVDESKDAEKMVTMLCRSVHQLAIVEQ
jgi:hypothetical protein